MKIYVFYEGLIKSKDGKTRRCLLKVPVDRKLSDLSPKDLRGAGIVEAFSLDDLHGIEIFAHDEVRIMGKGPITDNMLNWWRDAASERIKKMKRDAKKFFKASKPF